ncbi:hypothetical protein SCMU_00380 [Sinomonas cyclohexanicum]|uniref:TIR domain-containing protein n=1 Tax=Sinomonas cyclohexanicum TaxID=322009 RepID=A0ABN6FB53_SINCY|nr:hypothetical protein [Corynebacterium cyclohexanicum]BCT74196.1 hypothetical protein SCMU_00380 [Corynebacterium cyclohexanicum]
MTAWVFVARAVSHGTTRDEEYARAIERLVAGGGYGVRLGGSATPGEPMAKLVAQNINAVAQAAVLVAVLPESTETISSVWLEIGIAFAAARPMVIVAWTGTELPFLVLASADASPKRTVVVPAASTAHETAQAVLNSIREIPYAGPTT